MRRLLFALFICVYSGIILLNNPSKEKYPVRGIDVSHYQGDIDRAFLSKEENIRFAFIKATEGSSLVDEKFGYNFSEAGKAGFPDVRRFAFWQFTNRGRLKGYLGEEKYIDINVFNGSEDEFEMYPNKAG